jgi:hypothetical protein
MPDDLGQCIERVDGQFVLVQVDVQMLGSGARVTALVEHRIGKSNDHGLHRLAQFLRHQSDYQTGIHAAG